MKQPASMNAQHIKQNGNSGTSAVAFHIVFDIIAIQADFCRLVP